MAHVERTSPRWNVGLIRDAVADITGLREQEKEHLNPFKQSYYVDHEKKDNILKLIDIRINGKFDEVVVYSYDSLNGKGLLDFLPQSATKQTSLEYIAKEFGVNHEEVVFCGDSGNDISPLSAGFAGVLVRNADDQLIANVKKAQKDNPGLRVYFAKGGIKGLNGYYTGGVIEGAYHYGIFKE
jgi:hydroxymethylpyrimidine pyrophosphatase-like HAD family hydrolase